MIYLNLFNLLQVLIILTLYLKTKLDENKSKSNTTKKRAQKPGRLDVPL